MEVVERFEVGQRVRVRPEVDSPHFQWGAVKHGDIGHVASIEASADKMVIKFPNHNQWMGRMTEIETVAADEGPVLALAPLFEVGDRVRVKQWVTKPKYEWGNVKPGDVGVVQELDGLVCKVAFEVQESLWTGFAPEMEVLDDAGLPTCGQHTGMWRGSETKLYCSSPAKTEGPLCTHGPSIRANHWSCCGNTEALSRCGVQVAEASGIRVGDVVQVKSTVGEPTHGWGQVKPSDRGVVHGVTGGDLLVSFPERLPGKTWRGRASEMEVLQRFAKGLRVKVRPDIRNLHFDWGPVRPGDVGQVFGSSLEDDSVAVTFPRTAKWIARATELEVVEAEPEPADGADQVPVIGAGAVVRIKNFAAVEWTDVTPGDTGVVREVKGGGGAEQECEVAFSGKPQWTGKCADLELLDADGKPRPGQHAGMWRRQTGEYRCSRPRQVEGPLCMHSKDVVHVPHWSCCGGTDIDAKCSGGVVSAVPVPDDSDIRVGDVVRVKEAVGSPKHGWGRVQPGDRGVVRSVDGQDLEVSFPERPGQLWSGHAPDMEVLQRFEKGQQVRVRSEVRTPHYDWGPVSPGDIGQVVRVDPKMDRMVLSFPADEMWFARMTEIEVVEGKGIRG
eukprot:TRINITY_DN628_c0_g1_i7.p1 TRINITY_DN628_c0_g1~~TRINITY_DN628_c0_g1_i7.p1  ORF type:complete len:614 (+),score=189.39 TRINITY_DN628_c0_g1_i7:1503-3344(+)